MAKNKSSQFPKSPKPASDSVKNTQEKSPNPSNNDSLNQPSISSETSPATNPSRVMVQPEQMSLKAHAHIKKYLTQSKKPNIEKEDLNAVLRLSQHLRVFGLLSAVGYLNQSNAQENNETRKRTVPVWGLLLAQLLGQEIDTANPNQRRELMETVANMANTQPTEYMTTWRKSLILAEQWNFWARAYSKGE